MESKRELHANDKSTFRMSRHETRKSTFLNIISSLEFNSDFVIFIGYSSDFEPVPSIPYDKKNINTKYYSHSNFQMKSIETYTNENTFHTNWDDRFFLSVSCSLTQNWSHHKLPKHLPSIDHFLEHGQHQNDHNEAQSHSPNHFLVIWISTDIH